MSGHQQNAPRALSTIPAGEITHNSGRISGKKDSDMKTGITETGND
jgi:hypothetical protein